MVHSRVGWLRGGRGRLCCPRSGSCQCVAGEPQLSSSYVKHQLRLGLLLRFSFSQAGRTAASTSCLVLRRACHAPAGGPTLHAQLTCGERAAPGLELLPSGEPSVPVLLLKARQRAGDLVVEEEHLQAVADKALSYGALFSVMRATHLDTVKRPPLLRSAWPLGAEWPAAGACRPPRGAALA